MQRGSRIRTLNRGVTMVGGGMSRFGLFRDKDSKDLFSEAFLDMMASVDKGVDPEEIEALYVGNFSNDFFVHQAHWGPILSDLIGMTPKPATRTEGACASSALAFREGVFAIASGFYDLVLVGGVEEMSKRSTEEVAEGLALATVPYEGKAGHAGKREEAGDALTQGLLAGRSVLLVDDEPDVLDSLEALLDMCRIARAGDFETAKTLLENDSFDIAVLDIMGVDGYRLLEIALRQDTIPVMLTAHALSVENTIRSFEKGAASYLPKDQMANIATYLNDILEAKEKGKGFWWRWLTRMEEYYDRKFGPEWKAKDKDFWRKLTYYT